MRQIVLLVLSIVPSAFSQELDIADFEALLLPASTQARSGAYGSVWETEFLVRNDAIHPVIFGQGEPICRLGTCPSPFLQLPPETTEAVETGRLSSSPFVGELYYVEKKYADKVTMNLRLRETSRNLSSLGTNIPVIREAELRTGKIQLLNVRVSDLHRITLRTFEVDRRHSPRVRVRIVAGENIVWSGERALIIPSDRSFADAPAEDVVFSVETLIPPEACCDPVRIEIEPLQPGRYWAYATLVNNVTQEVLLITPE